MRNKKINIHKIDKISINEIDKYLKNINKSSRDVLKESVEMRINDLELDLETFTGLIISIISVEISFIPILTRYISNTVFFKTSIDILEWIIVFLGLLITIKINIFFFRRKRELLFNKFLLNRIELSYQKIKS
ncbi:MAG: hypothetical protein MR938_03510 [Tenericutes bacterium]|nr:hypothetical protein [Mycoplasmatota bacterium]